MAYTRITESIDCNSSALGGYVYLKFTHPTSKAVITGGNQDIEKLHRCLKLLLEQREELSALQLLPLKRDRSTQPIQFKLGAMSEREAEMEIGMMVLAAVGAGLDAGQLVGVTPPSISANTASGDGKNARLDEAKMERAFNATLEHLPDNISPIRVTAFVYDMESHAARDVRKEAVVFLERNKALSTDHATNQKTIATVVSAVESFRAAEQERAQQLQV